VASEWKRLPYNLYLCPNSETYELVVGPMVLVAMKVGGHQYWRWFIGWNHAASVADGMADTVELAQSAALAKAEQLFEAGLADVRRMMSIDVARETLRREIPEGVNWRHLHSDTLHSEGTRQIGGCVYVFTFDPVKFDTFHYANDPAPAIEAAKAWAAEAKEKA
jgi:hypothetical protein